MILQTKFVDIVPDTLEEGVLYVSIKYATVSHRCACGCGDEVVTPLSPAQWRITYDGENTWISPSIFTGQSGCNSHYWIERSKIRWSFLLFTSDLQRISDRDQKAAEQHFGSPQSPDPEGNEVKVPESSEKPKPSLFDRFQFLFRRR